MAKEAHLRHLTKRDRKQPSAFRLPQQQKATIQQLIAADKINCEFLAPDRWKIKRKQRIVAHGGCGRGVTQIAIRLNTDLLVDRSFLATAVGQFLTVVHNPVESHAGHPVS